jgi:putative Mn2+ efflux pump MntP
MATLQFALVMALVTGSIAALTAVFGWFRRH